MSAKIKSKNNVTDNGATVRTDSIFSYMYIISSCFEVNFQYYLTGRLYQFIFRTLK